MVSKDFVLGSVAGIRFNYALQKLWRQMNRKNHEMLICKLEETTSIKLVGNVEVTC